VQDASYLRSQAELCLQMARGMRDDKVAGNLRAAATQHFVRALEVERRPEPHRSDKISGMSRRRTVGEIALGAMPIRCKGLGDAIFPRRDDPRRFRLVVPGL
jgi:hypothetical protein